MADSSKAGQIVSDDEALKSGTSFVDLWLKKIERARDEEKEWLKDAKEAVDAYEAGGKDKPAFNIWHANIETLVPALYNSSPVPDVRRYFDQGDQIVKDAVDLAERAITYSLDQYDVDYEFQAAVKDSAITGRGILRMRYTPHLTTTVDQTTGEEIEQVGYQEAGCERVPHEKFIRGPGRAWTTIPWLAIEHDMTRDELEELAPDIAKDVPISDDSDGKRETSKRDAEKGILQTTRAFEIFDKRSGEVIWIAEKYKDKPLRREKDRLNLPGFFPVLRPIQPLERRSSLVPICQYKIYQPLLQELDTITKRISQLVKQLRVRGLIDGQLAADVEKLKSCEDGQYESADNATIFASAGGLEKGIAHWPLEPTVKALQQLYVQREQVKQTIYEITGLSDILRGASNPNETLGAQQMKQAWGSLRIQMQQKAIVAAAQQLIRMKVAVFSSKFTDENLSLMSGLPSTPEQQERWPKVLELFRSEIMRYRIDIETDSTIRADMSRNQEQMNLFMAAIGQFAKAMGGVIPQLPQLLPVAVEVLTAFARKFKLGKQAEDALDGLSSQVQQMMQQQQSGEEKPDPEAEKAKAEAEARKDEMAMKREGHKLDMDAKTFDLSHRQKMAELEIGTALAKAQMQMPPVGGFGARGNG